MHMEILPVFVFIILMKAWNNLMKIHYNENIELR